MLALLMLLLLTFPALTLPRLRFPRLTLARLTFPRLTLAAWAPADLFPTAGRAPPPPRAMLASATFSHTLLMIKMVSTTVIFRMAPFLFSNISFLQFTPARDCNLRLGDR